MEARQITLVQQLHNKILPADSQDQKLRSASLLYPHPTLADDDIMSTYISVLLIHNHCNKHLHHPCVSYLFTLLCCFFLLCTANLLTAFIHLLPNFSWPFLSCSSSTCQVDATPVSSNFTPHPTKLLMSAEQ